MALMRAGSVERSLSSGDDRPFIHLWKCRTSITWSALSMSTAAPTNHQTVMSKANSSMVQFSDCSITSSCTKKSFFWIFDVFLSFILYGGHYTGTEILHSLTFTVYILNPKRQVSQPYWRMVQ